MPATLLLDRNIEGTQLDNGVYFKQYKRCGIVKDIDVPTTGYDGNVLVKSLASAGMPQLGDLHPSITNCFVVRHVVRGLASNQASVDIYYETPQTGSAISPVGTFVLKDSTALTTEATQVTYSYGGSQATPIKAVYKPTSGSNTNQITYITSVNHLVPLRVLTASAFLNGKPSSALLGAIGRVNASPWQGLPTGYWLCAGITSEIQQLNGANPIYTCEAAFMSKQTRDWSSYVTFKDDRGQTPSDIDPAQVTGLQQQPYANAVAFINGLTKVGLYIPIDFSSLFPF